MQQNTIYMVQNNNNKLRQKAMSKKTASNENSNPAALILCCRIVSLQKYKPHKSLSQQQLSSKTKSKVTIYNNYHIKMKY